MWKRRRETAHAEIASDPLDKLRNLASRPSKYVYRPAKFDSSKRSLKELGWDALKVILVVVALLVAVPLYGVLGRYFNFPSAYAIYYNVNTSDVFIEIMPHDCDFDKAPLGNKECHFEKVITEDRSSGHRRIYISWEKVAD